MAAVVEPVSLAVLLTNVFTVDIPGVGGLVLAATAALDPERADWIIVPGAAGSLGTEGDPGSGTSNVSVR